MCELHKTGVGPFLAAADSGVRLVGAQTVLLSRPFAGDPAVHPDRVLHAIHSSVPLSRPQAKSPLAGMRTDRRIAGLLPSWLTDDGPERVRRYRLEYLDSDLMLKVEVLAPAAASPTPWRLELSPPAAAGLQWGVGLHRDMGSARWREAASLSFCLGQWWLTPNVFSKTGDAIVIPTPLPPLDRCRPDTTDTPRRRPARPARPEASTGVRAWLASRGLGEYWSYVSEAFRAAGYKPVEWVSQLEEMSPAELRQLVSSIDRTAPADAHVSQHSTAFSQPRFPSVCACLPLGFYLQDCCLLSDQRWSLLRPQLEVCVSLYAAGLSETWRCQFAAQPSSAATPTAESAPPTPPPPRSGRRGSVDDTLEAVQEKLTPSRRRRKSVFDRSSAGTPQPSASLSICCTPLPLWYVFNRPEEKVQIDRSLTARRTRSGRAACDVTVGGTGKHRRGGRGGSWEAAAWIDVGAIVERAGGLGIRGGRGG